MTGEEPKMKKFKIKRTEGMGYKNYIKEVILFVVTSVGLDQPFCELLRQAIL